MQNRKFQTKGVQGDINNYYETKMLYGETWATLDNYFWRIMLKFHESHAYKLIKYPYT